MTKSLTALAFAAAALIAPMSANAATVSIGSSMGGTFEATTGIGDTTTTQPSDLAGALITAVYSDGTQETMTWRRLGSTRWGARGSSANVLARGDAMRLATNKTVQTLSLDLTPSATVFDTIDTRGMSGGGISTPSTSFGVPFFIQSDHSHLVGDIDVTYSGAVNIAGHATVGDIFTRMQIDFTDLQGGGFMGRLTFGGDTDVLAAGASLSRVPLPASLPVLLLGLGVFGFLSRRKHSAVA